MRFLIFPKRHFHFPNFGAKKSVDQRFRIRQNLSEDGSLDSKVVKRPVGRIVSWPNIEQFWSLPTNPLTILEPQNQEIGELYVAQERCATDFEAPKLWKGSSGSSRYVDLRFWKYIKSNGWTGPSPVLIFIHSSWLILVMARDTLKVSICIPCIDI